MRGLIINVYHSGPSIMDLALTDGYDEALLVGEGVPEIFEANGRPVLKIVKRMIGGELYKHLQPLEQKTWTYGGNIGYTSDSRFPNTYPLKIHDREL